MVVLPSVASYSFTTASQMGKTIFFLRPQNRYSEISNTGLLSVDISNTGILSVARSSAVPELCLGSLIIPFITCLPLCLAFQLQCLDNA